MRTEPDFDVAAAHRYFAAYCFNEAWSLIDMPSRTAAQDRLMVALSQASLFHWLNRPDCDAKRLAVGYWQTSRIHAILGNAPEALRQADICLAHSISLEPFYLGYAYESLARAARIAGDEARRAENLAKARAQAALVPAKEDRERLLQDLADLE